MTEVKEESKESEDSSMIHPMFLRAFLRSLFLSSTSLAYYEEVMRTPRLFSWRYFALLHAAVALVAAGMITVSLLPVQPSLRQIGSDNWNTMVSLFPPDLSLHLGNGEITINHPLPYAIPIPLNLIAPEVRSDEEQIFRQELQRRDFPLNAFVFVGSDTVDAETFRTQQAFAVVGRRQVAMMVRGGATPSIQTTTIPSITLPFAVTRARLDAFTWAVTTFHLYDMGAFALFTCVLALAIVFAFSFVQSLVWVAIAAMLLSVVRPRRFRFGTLLQVALHAYTPILLVSIMLAFLPAVPYRTIPLRTAFIIFLGIIAHRLGQQRLDGR